MHVGEALDELESGRPLPGWLSRVIYRHQVGRQPESMDSYVGELRDMLAIQLPLPRLAPVGLIDHHLDSVSMAVRHNRADFAAERRFQQRDGPLLERRMEPGIPCQDLPVPLHP